MRCSYCPCLPFAPPIDRIDECIEEKKQGGSEPVTAQLQSVHISELPIPVPPTEFLQSASLERATFGRWGDGAEKVKVLG